MASVFLGMSNTMLLVYEQCEFSSSRVWAFCVPVTLFCVGHFVWSYWLCFWLACLPRNEFTLFYWFMSRLRSVFHGGRPFVGMSHFFVTGTVFARTALLSMAMCFHGMDNNILLVYE
jgi:hypothetical protein